MIILLAILVVAIVAIIAERAFKQHIDKINTIDEEVFSLNQDDLKQVNVEYGNDEITLEKKDNEWYYTKDDKFPVDQDYVSDMLSKFESVHASFIIDDVDDYSQYGLATPTATVNFTTEDGDSKITFGTFSTMDEKRYICVDDGSVYLIDEDILEDVSAKADDFLLRDKAYDYSQLKSLVATGDADANVVYDPDGKYSYTDEYDYYQVDGDEHKALSESKISDYLNSLSSLDLTQYETYSATEKDLKKYGLDNPGLVIKLSGEVKSEDNEDETETKSQTINFAKSDDVAYVNFEGSSIVYTITSDDYDKMAEVGYAALRPSEVVNIDWTRVSKIKVKYGDETATIKCEPDKKNGNTYTIDDEKLDFVTATTTINGLKLTEVGDSYEKGEEELAIAIALNDDDNTVVKIGFYQYDGDSCIVTVDGKEVGLCDRPAMSGLREEITSAVLNKGKDADKE